LWVIRHPLQIAAVAMGWYRQIKLKTQIAHWKLTNIRNNNTFATYGYDGLINGKIITS
jgi:hypothetical protein